MEFEQFFPTFVGVDRLDDLALNEAVLSEVEEIREQTPNGRPSSWACSLYTTFTNRGALHLEYPGFRRLTLTLLGHVEQYADYIGVDSRQARATIAECWLNVYCGTDNQEVHNHARFHISGVYYPKAPHGCGKINFYTPLIEDNFAQLPAAKFSWKTQGLASVQPEDRTVVLFRSWLRHAVTPGTSTEERVSIAFNALLVPPEVAQSNNARLTGG